MQTDPEITVKATITIVCDECGNDLEGDYDQRRDRVLVRPCEGCLEKARIEGMGDE